jgi:hypothetical protein
MRTGPRQLGRHPRDIVAWTSWSGPFQDSRACYYGGAMTIIAGLGATILA